MKDKTTAAILAFFLGPFGIHKFYLGNTAAGVLYLAFFWTFIPTLLAFVDFLVLALMDNEEFNRRYNRALMPPVTVNMLPPAHHYPGPYGYGAPGAHAGHPMGPFGPAPGSHGHGAPQGGGPLDPDELGRRLEKLNELRISGLLTEEEFSAQKARLLNQL